MLEAEQLREDTAAMIAHDIKIPLTSIIGFASMINEGDHLHERTAERRSLSVSAHPDGRFRLRSVNYPPGATHSWSNGLAVLVLRCLR